MGLWMPSIAGGKQGAQQNTSRSPFPARWDKQPAARLERVRRWLFFDDFSKLKADCALILHVRSHVQLEGPRVVQLASGPFLMPPITRERFLALTWTWMRLAMLVVKRSILKSVR